MIELKKDFVKWKRHFLQMYKDENIVIYKVSTPHADDEGFSSVFEVFRYKTAKPDRFHNDEWECYPSDESFGYWAWCCSNKEVLYKTIKKHWGKDFKMPQI